MLQDLLGIVSSSVIVGRARLKLAHHGFRYSTVLPIWTFKCIGLRTVDPWRDSSRSTSVLRSDDKGRFQLFGDIKCTLTTQRIETTGACLPKQDPRIFQNAPGDCQTLERGPRWVTKCADRVYAKSKRRASNFWNQSQMRYSQIAKRHVVPQAYHCDGEAPSNMAEVAT